MKTAYMIPEMIVTEIDSQSIIMGSRGTTKESLTNEFDAEFDDCE